MKKILVLAVSTLLLVGCNKAKTTEVKENGLPKAGAVSKNQTSGSSIAYVEIDSLATQYQFCKDQQEILKKKQEGYSATLQKLGRDFESAAANFQKKIQEGKFNSEQEARNEQASLQRRQQDIAKKEEQYNIEMTDATSDYQKELLKRINTFLKEYNKDGRYSMIITNSEASLNVLYADSTLNITKDVIDGLNKEYNKKK